MYKYELVNWFRKAKNVLIVGMTLWAQIGNILRFLLLAAKSKFHLCGLHPYYIDFPSNALTTLDEISEPRKF